MRVLFWGTPEFAVPSLRALSEEGHAVVGIVTRPDRPAGRGRRVRPPAVKAVAEPEGIPILQPERPRGEEFLLQLSLLDPEVSVVAAYGALLPEEVLELPAYGSINVHASLLPALRGAAPVSWAIIRGHTESGVTIMRMVRELDAGPILHQVAVEIGPRTTAGELSDLLAEMGARALIETLALLEAGELEPQPQDDSLATYAPKLDREQAHLDWSLSAPELERWIRGCDPWPGAWSELDGAPLQLFRAAVVGDEAGAGAGGDGAAEAGAGAAESGRASGPEGGGAALPPAEGGSDGAGEAADEAGATAGAATAGAAPGGAAGGGAAPGTIVRADAREGLVVATGDGALHIGEVKPAGRSRMSAAAWVRGRGAEVGRRLE